MAKSFTLSIAKLTENIFEGRVLSVTVPGEEGVLTILASHEALVTPLKEGTISYTPEEGASQSLAIERGIVEVSDNHVTVLL